MSSIFYNNSIVAKLYSILLEIENPEDKNTIAELLKKYLIGKNEFYCTAEELSKISKVAQRGHYWAIWRSRTVAAEYMCAITNTEIPENDNPFRSVPKCFLEISVEYTDQTKLFYNKWEEAIDRVESDAALTRACIYKKTDPEIRKEVIDSFDIYVSTIFIEKYSDLKKEFDNLDK